MYRRRRKQYLLQQITIAENRLSRLGDQIKSCEGQFKGCEGQNGIAEKRLSQFEYRMKGFKGQIQTFKEQGDIAGYRALSGAQYQFLDAQKARIFDLEEAVFRSIDLSQSLSDTVASQNTAIRELEVQMNESTTSYLSRDVMFCQDLGSYESLQLENYDMICPGTRTPCSTVRSTEALESEDLAVVGANTIVSGYCSNRLKL